MDVRDAHGEAIRDDTFIVLLNAHYEPVKFTLPGREDVHWELMLDTETGFLEPGCVLHAGEALELIDRSLCLLRLHTGSHSHARSESRQRPRKNG